MRQDTDASWGSNDDADIASVVAQLERLAHQLGCLAEAEMRHQRPSTHLLDAAHSIHRALLDLDADAEDGFLAARS